MNAPLRLIHHIVDFAVGNRAAVLVVLALLSCVGYWCMTTMPLDALPDLSDTQVIINTRWDRSPDVIERQITYPLVTALLSAPHVKTVRGFSDFGSSYVYVIFDDNTDLSWARQRTLEYLAAVQAQLPPGVHAEMGPDATSLGWIYQYALVDTTGQHSLADLRAYQDWTLRYSLRSVKGVAEVAPIGGLTRQFQVNVDPKPLAPLQHQGEQVVRAVREGNAEAAGQVLEFGGSEYMVRGRGYAHTLDDFRQMVVASPGAGIPVRVGDLGEVAEGPEPRRGTADLDGTGNSVSGIIIMRTGDNALRVIDRVKTRLKQLEPGLPAGIKIVSVYDRSLLIHETISSTRFTILQIVVTVMLIVLIFLWHFPSAAIPLLTMPVAVLIAFIPLRLMGISINVMSLAGIAIAFGELVDASIVVVEQSHKRLEQWQHAGSHGKQRDIILNAIKEVSGPIVFSLLIIAVSVLPVLALQSQEGRLFKPLAYSKGIAVAVAAVLALTLDPALRLLLSGIRPFRFRPAMLCKVANALLIGRVRSEEQHPLSGWMTRMYLPVVAWTLRNRLVVLVTTLCLILLTIPVALSLGSEFMPQMEEGSILFMPTTMPGISVQAAQQLLTTTDRILMQFPEVDHVFGKAGHAETATDPAPLSMLETIITLKPRASWRHRPTWYSSWAPQWSRPVLRHLTPDTISTGELIHQMDRAVHAPGLSNAWTTPIRGRVDMLSTGIRTPLGLKIQGSDPVVLQQIAAQMQAVLPSVPGTRSAFAEQAAPGSFLDVNWRRDQLARYGVTMEQAQQVLQTAVGGDNVSTVLLGTQRIPVSVRYQEPFRNSVEALGHVLVPTGGNRQTPISDLADVQISSGPSMLRDEDGALTAYVFLDVETTDFDTYIAQADRALHRQVALPAGYTTVWSGQRDAMQRVRHRLALALPATALLILLLLYLSTRSVVKTLIVVLAGPFSAVGAIWFIWFLHYDLSVAVWVGLISLLSIDAETGVFMLLYLDLAYEDARSQNRMSTLADLHQAILYGAARRLRPKFMTFATTCIGLFPVMWSTSAGASMMKHIAAPMIGGIFASFFLELLVYPVLYEIWRRRSLGYWPKAIDSPQDQESLTVA